MLAAGSTASLTLDHDVVVCVSLRSIYVCVSVCGRASAHFTFMRARVCMCVCFQSLVLHNSDSVCNILQSLDCLFIETVQ